MSCDNDTDNETRASGHHFITYGVSKEFIQPRAAFYNWLFVSGKILVLYGSFRYHSLTVKGPKCIRRKNGGDLLSKCVGKLIVKTP